MARGRRRVGGIVGCVSRLREVGRGWRGLPVRQPEPGGRRTIWWPAGVVGRAHGPTVARDRRERRLVVLGSRRWWRLDRTMACRADRIDRLGVGNGPRPAVDAR